MGPGGGFPYGDWERDIQAISDWLVAEALGRVKVRPLLAGFCDAMNAAGLPILRAISALSTLHPMYVAHTYTYVRGRGNVTSDIPHGAQNTEAWQKSPLKPMFDNDVTECRYDLTDPAQVAPFPLLAEARDLGGTDYLGLLTLFEAGGELPDEVHHLDGLMTSWVTDRPEGFAAKHLRALRRLVPRFALAAKMAKREETALNIVTAYMGRDAGCRVLNGQIKLGDGEIIPSVIWYSDMRNSTELCETLSHGDYLAALNQYFACTAGAVMEGGARSCASSAMPCWRSFPSAMAATARKKPAPRRLPQPAGPRTSCCGPTQRDARWDNRNWISGSACTWARSCTAISGCPRGSNSRSPARPPTKSPDWRT